MIEDAIYLALGFCVATLIALACIPILWARAMRLTRQRLERLVPLSRREIDAERDGLRAQAAVAQRQLEQTIERGRSDAAAVKVELGRRTVALVDAERIGAELRADRDDLRIELAEAARQLRDAEGQRGATEKALHDADNRIDTAAMAAREQQGRYDALWGLSEERRGAIASLETRVAGLLAKVEDRDDAIVALNASLADLRTAQAKLIEERDALRESLSLVSAERAILERNLAEERSKAEERERRLEARATALATAEARMSEQDSIIAASKNALAELQLRFDALERRLKEAETADRDGLRNTIVTLGDDALQLLRSPVEHDGSAVEKSTGERLTADSIQDSQA